MGTNLQDKIIKKIQDGEVRMRPRLYFVLRAVALAAVVLATLVVSVFICNFLFFTLRLNGHESLLARPGGFLLFLRFFPWELLALDILLLALLDWLVRKFGFGYRTPLVYIAILSLALVFSMGFAIDRATDLNDRVLRHADDDDLPFPFGGVYERARRPLPPGFRPDFDNDWDDEIIMEAGV